MSAPEPTPPRAPSSHPASADTAHHAVVHSAKSRAGAAWTSDPDRPRVVVVGAGFGGLATARALSDAPCDVVVLDGRNHHLFQPLLYQVATAALSPAEIAWPIRHLLRRQANATVVMARVDAIDVETRMVSAGALSWSYDHLVIAAGSRHSYFGREDWAPYAPGLKTLEDATDIRRRVLETFERHEAEPRNRPITLMVVGGGPTGVEMAGALTELSRHALRDEFRNTDPARARVILVEAGPRILPALNSRLAREGHDRLEAMGVEIRTETRVLDCGPAGVTLSAGPLAADVVVWAAGVQASELVSRLPVDRDRSGRALVNDRLEVPGHPQIRVLGDAAAITDAAGRPVPGIAPAAKQAGRYVGDTIARTLRGRGEDRPFRYHHAGNLATIGTGSAVVELGRFRLTGLVGWLFWSVVHVFFMIGVRNRVAVALDWVWGGLTRQRASRLVLHAAPAGPSGRVPPAPTATETTFGSTRGAGPGDADTGAG